MYRVFRVCAGHGYMLNVEFADGTNGTVDLAPRLFGPVFEPLPDQGLFLKCE